MASALQELCDSLLAAVRPVDASVTELTSQAARLRVSGNRIGALGRSAQSLELRSAGAQLLAAAAAFDRAAVIATGTTRQARIYVGGMLATGQVRPSAPATHATAASVPVGEVSPAYRKQVQREAWVAIVTEVGRELAWEVGPLIIGAVLDTDLPSSAVIRQATVDLPVAVAEVAQVLKKIGKRE